ncbi:SDR family oxidoreductase [Sphingomonas mucosissima]|uniref:Bacilysin biosynthesis oxidoreductase YwfH n=1 Tax=Sphingomonas mucosissima TaxID=370959 RepID=A0A245ZFG9_9SPHN|nr:SDR family oxidoreductase [Sphingomonas mucosissima]OWK28485.1 bacilysin biosynthesis oxidoreductase YwfH [Sphingomonas mucosissima]
MDLGLAGKTAIICASSQGLGKACAEELARAGCRIVMNGRDAKALAEAAEAIRDETGVLVESVAGDIGDPGVQMSLVQTAGAPDILVNNNGGPPPRGFRALDSDAIHAGLDANMVTPIRMVQQIIDGMVQRKFGRIICITSGSVKSPVAGLDLSSGARLGLHGFLAGVAREVASANVTINFLMPGLFATRRLGGVMAFAAKAQSIDVETAEARGRERIPAKRFGDPAEFGAACAFLCSAQAGFITGQSLLIDGGAFPGVL